MVTKLSSHDQEALNRASLEAARLTSAKIEAVIVPSSGSYQQYVLIYGLILGTVLAGVLWFSHIISDVPLLFAVQFVAVIICDLIPFLRSLVITLLPRRVRHHHAGQAALHDFHVAASVVSPYQPLVLLYVSIAERYVHVVTGPTVHKAVPGEWHKVTKLFEASASEPAQAVGANCVKAVSAIAHILARPFPPVKT